MQRETTVGMERTKQNGSSNFNIKKETSLLYFEVVLIYIPDLDIFHNMNLEFKYVKYMNNKVFHLPCIYLVRNFLEISDNQQYFFTSLDLHSYQHINTF